MICYIAGNVEAGNSLKPHCDGSHRSTFVDNSALLPSDITDFAMCSAQRFWWERILFLDVM